MRILKSEVVAHVKRQINAASDDEAMLYYIHMLEGNLADIDGREAAEESEYIYAPEYVDLYESFIKMKMYRNAEDWDCADRWESIFMKRISEYAAKVNKYDKWTGWWR